MAFATLIDILVRARVIDLGEITRAYAKFASELRQNPRLGETGPRSLEQIVSLVRANRETQGHA
jgi:hypothetical protein